MKHIFNNFSGGLALHSDKVGPENSYAEARDIDIHDEPGYIKPGWAASNISTSMTPTELILDACSYNTVSGEVYAIGTADLWKMTSGGKIITNGGATWPHDISGTGDGKSVFSYYIGATEYIFYVMGVDMGRLAPGGPTFIDNYLTDAGELNESALIDGPHPTIEWKSYRWIADNRYLHKFDGQTGAKGTWYGQELDLGKGWEITALFPSNNYIGVCAWKKMSTYSYRTECAVFFFDGESDDWTYMIPIENNKIQAAINLNGIVYLFTEGRDAGYTSFERLTENGTKLINKLQFDIEGTTVGFNVRNPNLVDSFNGRLIFGAYYAAAPFRNVIFSYGSTGEGFQVVLSQPWSGGETITAADVGCLKSLFGGSIFLSSKVATTGYRWTEFNNLAGPSTNADWHGLYFDAGQRMRVNYVKFYFKPLVANDDVTVGLDTDYGTANELSSTSTITYTRDGAVTSKIFRKPIICHAFRPTINWTAGGVAFSKIVVDYDFIGD